MEEGGGRGGAVPWSPFARACWGIITIHVCWVLVAVRPCWCWALIRSSSVMFVLHSLVIHGHVAVVVLGGSRGLLCGGSLCWSCVLVVLWFQAVVGSWLCCVVVVGL